VLAEGWRRTDVSWRWSLRGLDPQPWVGGDDLSVAEKKALGLAPTRLAFRQSGFVSEPARQAGIRPGDVIVGVDGKTLHLTARQLSAHVRLGYKVGDRITYNLLREGKRLDATLTLRRR
jgi:S1-C subfamily serine protease